MTPIFKTVVLSSIFLSGCYFISDLSLVKSRLKTQNKLTVLLVNNLSADKELPKNYALNKYQFFLKLLNQFFLLKPKFNFLIGFFGVFRGMD